MEPPAEIAVRSWTQSPFPSTGLLRWLSVASVAAAELRRGHQLVDLVVVVVVVVVVVR